MELYEGRQIFNIPHEQNHNRPGSAPDTSQTLLSTSPLLLSTSGCFQAPFEVRNVLSDSERAFTVPSKRSRSYGGRFMMLQYLRYMILNLWSAWDLYTGLRGTPRPPEIWNIWLLWLQTEFEQDSQKHVEMPIGILMDALEGHCGRNIHFSA